MEQDVDGAGRYVDRKFDNGVQDVEDVPEDIAGGVGRFDGDVRRKWDDGVQDVEDVPEDIAGGFGRMDGRVDRFDDNVDNAYDSGRQQGYDDDDRRDDDDY